MRTIYTISALLLMSISAFAQSKAKTIFRYGEQVNILPDTCARAGTFTATPNSGKIYLHWTVFNSVKPGMYVIERSAGNGEYEVIGFKKAIPSSLPLELAFYFTDNEPLTGKASYKVTHIAGDNTYFEFEPVTVKNPKGGKPTLVIATASN